MLNNPVKREALKATGAGLALMAGGQVAASLAAMLGVGVESLGYLGEKRTKELFDNEVLVDKVISEINRSDDFSGLVFDIWTRHNFESSESRRRILKSILEKAAYEKNRNYENFTKIISTAQQISVLELEVANAFYSKNAYKFSKLPGDTKTAFRLNHEQAKELTTSITKASIEDNELTVALNQLGHYGILGVHYNSIGGPFYWQALFGRLLLGYIKS